MLGATRDARLSGQFNEIIDCIANGCSIPDEYYRRDVDRNRDRLLEETGVKHLHLDGPGSDKVVYLVELVDRVILLRIDNHVHLEDEPRGNLLRKILGLPPVGE